MEHLASLSRYDLVAALLQSLLIVGAFGTAFGYFTKRSGNRSSNIFFALLLVAFALSIGSLVFEHLGLPAKHPSLRFVPLWFTWTIGPAWFFYVKFSVFPSYQWRWTDAKHFVMPAGQAVYYTAVFFGGLGEIVPETIFGFRATTLDEVIFLLSVFGYLFASYRYLRYKARKIGEQRLRWDYWKVKLLRRSQRVLFVLLTFNFIFVVFNFTTVQQSGVGLLHLRGFYASSSLSFGLILLYLLRGVAYRQHFYPQVPIDDLANVGDSAADRLDALTTTYKGFCDPDLHEVRVARAVGIPPQQLNELAQEKGHKNWWRWIESLRVQEILRLRASKPISLRKASLDVGFASLRVALRALRKRN